MAGSPEQIMLEAEDSLHLIVSLSRLFFDKVSPTCHC